MPKAVIYMEFDGMAVGENGEPCPAGAKLEFEYPGDTVPDYEAMTRKLDPNALMAAFGLESLSGGHPGRVIGRAEYKEKYEKE